MVNGYKGLSSVLRLFLYLNPMKPKKITFTAPEDGTLRVFGSSKPIEMKKGEKITFDPPKNKPTSK